jgi:hypothetical protein
LQVAHEIHHCLVYVPRLRRSGEHLGAAVEHRDVLAVEQDLSAVACVERLGYPQLVRPLQQNVALLTELDILAAFLNNIVVNSNGHAEVVGLAQKARHYHQLV